METGQLDSPADRYGQGSRFYRNTKRVLKVLAYFIFFLLVLCSAVASKGSFLLMTQSLGNAKQERQYASRWSMLITAAICIPYIFVFMESIAHSLFRNRKGPSVLDILIVFFLEGIHTFGLSLLVFRVLPSCDVVRAILLMNCLCLIPGILKMVFSKSYTGTVGKALIVMIDFLAVIAQLSVFFVIMGTEYTSFIQKAESTTNTGLPDISIGNPFGDSERLMVGEQPKPTWKGSWEAPIALLFTSIAWWENYVDRDIKLLCFKIPFASYKRHLQSVRSKANIGASLWKIALTITFSIVMLPSGKFDNAFVNIPQLPDAPIVTMPPVFQSEPLSDQRVHIMNKRQADFIASTVPSVLSSVALGLESVLTVPNNAFNNPTTPNPYDQVPEDPMNEKWKTIEPFVPFIVHFFSTAMCYYFAKSSCKMCMQRIAFALPLTLATPLTIGIYMAICSNGLPRIEFIENMMYWECSEALDQGSLKWQLIFGLGLWWLSEIWITLHSWFPESKRLASTEQ